MNGKKKLVDILRNCCAHKRTIDLINCGFFISCKYFALNYDRIKWRKIHFISISSINLFNALWLLLLLLLVWDSFYMACCGVVLWRWRERETIAWLLSMLELNFEQFNGLEMDAYLNDWTRLNWMKFRYWNCDRNLSIFCKFTQFNELNMVCFPHAIGLSLQRGICHTHNVKLSLKDLNREIIPVEMVLQKQKQKWKEIESSIRNAVGPRLRGIKNESLIFISIANWTHN